MSAYLTAFSVGFYWRAVARKVTKYHAANRIQNELATMSKFVQEQLRARITSRAVLDRVVQIHETMVRELFDEMDDDSRGSSPQLRRASIFYCPQPDQWGALP